MLKQRDLAEGFVGDGCFLIRVFNARLTAARSPE
jgi:hypothetical protein